MMATSYRSGTFGMLPPIPATSGRAHHGGFAGPFERRVKDALVGWRPMADVELKRTPLESEHRSIGAKLGPFAGWLMPIEYAGALSEHQAVRERAGIFDLTHLGKVDVTGPGALELLQGIVTGDLSTLDIGEAQYG